MHLFTEKATQHRNKIKTHKITASRLCKRCL